MATAPSLPAVVHEKWTRDRADAEVQKYLAKRQHDYDELATRVLVDRDAAAAKQFSQIFGPTVIANAVGNGCQRQYIERAPTYRAKLKPLIRRPAQYPPGWTPPINRNSKLQDTMERMRRQARGSSDAAAT